MDADQRSRANPFGMDEECRNCPALCEARERVVHGFGDVGAEFLFVAAAPTPAAERTGVPLAGETAAPLRTALAELGFYGVDPDDVGAGTAAADPEDVGAGAGPTTDAAADAADPHETGAGAASATDPADGADPQDGKGDPELVNAYLTHLTRCRDPERDPTDEEVRNCEPFLNAEVRMVNPEILVPVGERALRELGREYTTTPAGELSLSAHHATRIRGRGFELFPTYAPGELDEARRTAFLDAFRELLASDYRQTKGRRRR